MFGAGHGTVYPIVCGFETDDDALVLHGNNGDKLDVSKLVPEDNKTLAKLTKHSTAMEAASIAKEAGVKRLVLGHYSSRYKNEQLFLQEACSVFTPVELSEQGKVFQIENQA